ncbi:N-acetyltransferase family protein [Mesorhizobium sp. 1B3]|uniref:GNAT family N-acetyltransferase n=1 Tax=Mesorhizobium sp. 1B3 TaxID=3243599 RepID=UPI003D99329B
MANGLTIRVAEKRDAAELAILVDISSHGLASWLWDGAVLDGSVDTALEKGRLVMRDDPREGWQSAVLAEWNGDVAGVSISYRVDQKVADQSAAHPVVEPILTLQRLAIGNRFIDSLGVYREHRGKGIGRALVEHEIARADEPISLITESHNMKALRLYRSCGFAEISRKAAVPRLPDDERHDWVLLTRNPA